MTTIPGTEHFSPQKLDLLHLLFDFPPTRLIVAVSMMRRFLERQKVGMPLEEATRVMWQEAVDDRFVPIEAVPPDIRIQTPLVRCDRVALTVVASGGSTPRPLATGRGGMPDDPV